MRNRLSQIYSSHRVILLASAAIASLVLALAGAGLVFARHGGISASQASPMHPTITLLDAGGQKVIESGMPVSTMETCGECHDTEFIASHSDHTSLGPDTFPAPGELFSAAEPSKEGMNCFLCHTSSPNNPARQAELLAGRADWSTTATLLGTGIVEGEEGAYRYQPSAFTEDGELAVNTLLIQDPSSENCGQCHGTVHTDLTIPLTLSAPSSDWRASTTGQVIAAQRIADSGLNIAGKEELIHSFDVHAERNLSCTDCHYSLNNPVYYQEDSGTQPEYLNFDPRRLEIGEYLYRPVHNFARGGSASGTADPQVANTMRRCESCHTLEATHDWLPYKDRHTSAVSCETCHIPQINAPAFESVDYTVMQADGAPRTELRGIASDGLITGYQPLYLQRPNPESEAKFSPFNTVAAWYWVAGDPARPVSQSDLKKAWFDEKSGGYAVEIISLFDENGDGSLGTGELAIDSDEKESLIVRRLAGLGLKNPHIIGEVQPYSLNHSVVSGNWAIRECSACHSSDASMEQPFVVSEYLPGGVIPQFVADPGAEVNPARLHEDGGRLVYAPSSDEAGLYVLGNDAVGWIDLFGGLSFAGVMLAVAGHGALRFAASLRKPHRPAETKTVYMYTAYERLWHWLQTFTILGLIFTGLIIHKPDIFGIFSFRYVVLVHNILAGILLVNAALSLFYHLVSGEIRQYLPRPAGFFDQAIVQAKYYLEGIFKGEPHPFEKTPEKKLNPLQQMTYFVILNILLPLQVIIGILMWGVQQWPELTARLGGLSFLAPFHSLVAWLFASFVIAHVYLTTTGYEPLTSIRAMMMGWDELEEPIPAEETGD